MVRLFLVVLAFIAGEAHSAPELCAGLSPAKVVVTPLWAEPAYHNDRTVPELTARSAKGSPVDSRRRTLGLTTAASRSAISISYRHRTDTATGKSCVSPLIEVSVGYTSMRVDVASEFRPGSCAYGQIRAHEDMHVHIYKVNLARTVEALQAEMGQHFAGGPYLSDGTRLESYFEEAKKEWSAHISRKLAAVDSQQAAFDSPAEYRRLGSSCGGTIAKVLRPEG